MTGSAYRNRLHRTRRELPPGSLGLELGQDSWRLVAEGHVLEDAERYEDALDRYEAAIRLAPDLSCAHVDRGNALWTLGQLECAARAYETALAYAPKSVASHFNLGIALQALGKHESAARLLHQALRLAPNDAGVHNALGHLLIEQGHPYVGLAHLRRVLALEPRNPFAYNNIGVAYRHLGQLRDALASYELALGIDPELTATHSNLLFTHNYLVDQDARALLESARRFGELTARLARPYCDWPNMPDEDRLLRVGLVSGDLRNHPVGYFVEAVLSALASEASCRLEIFGYSNCESVDSITTRIMNSCRSWRRVDRLTDEQLAQRIRADSVDILVDLSGHTALNRLPMFAWKPAPVQVSWLGYFATTGVAAIDYIIADPWTLPETEECNFSEQVWRLPETRLCFTPPDEQVSVAPLPASINGFVTFGCFNNVAKMNDTVVALWARVLAAVPESRLFLKSGPIREASVRQRITERFAIHGITAERLILEGASPRADYLAAYGRVDISLDPFPFPGGTTSVEGLWMGTPVLTLAGSSFLSRQGAGLLMAAGLSDWVAADAEDYVARATAHACNLTQLAELRSRLRLQVLSSPIFDAARFARNLETALRGMWHRWCARKNALSQSRPD